MSLFARVIVDDTSERLLDYAIPAAMSGRVDVGSRVRVPLRSRLVLGTVAEIVDGSEVQGVRELAEVLATRPEIPPTLFRLAEWVADYYCCPRDVALRVVLPKVVRAASVKPRIQKLVHALREPDSEEFLRLERRAPRQAAVLRFLISHGKPIVAAEALRRTDAPGSALGALERAGWIEVQHEESARDPHRNDQFVPTSPLTLNAEQAQVLRAVLDTMGGDKERKPILLHGVTGSGKTEIYLQAIRSTVDAGRTALVLVPEIALTPQTTDRFRSRFAEIRGHVAVLHSKLSDGERYDEWSKIRDGRASIVIGARSAVFAPLADLGLIVVDEEHESSYKQEDAPRYHARDVAVVRGRLENVTVLLGSATPSLESAHNARIGKYALLRMTHRVDDRRMPMIRVLDMRNMNRSRGADPILSLPLRGAIDDRLRKGEQVILFLNRRGYASSILCNACGFVAECPHCSVSLTYHRDSERIHCHICGHSAKAPSKCPQCRDPGIRHSGTGTQRVEETVRRMFSKARIERMDADSMSRKHAMRDTLGAFRAGKIDILIGTQMIAKGLDFPNVTLVGIINADLSLHLPDFRAGERTFQLLTQVAGRAGRGDVVGEVFVQSFTPAHSAIQFARHHDFNGFLDEELEFRRRFEYPPFTHMVMVTVRSPVLEKAEFSAQTIRRRVAPHVPPGTILGEVSPAPLERSHGFHRFHLAMRGHAVRALATLLRRQIDELTFPEDVHVAVDVDPYQLL